MTYDPYFGSLKCVNDIERLSVNGYATITEDKIVRDPKTGHVIEIVNNDNDPPKKKKRRVA